MSPLSPSGGIALIEHQVDNRQDRFKPLGQITRSRNLERDRGVADLRLRAHQALSQCRGSREERTGDLLRRQTANLPESERDLHLAVDGRVATGEDEPEAVILNLTRRP